MIMKDSEQVLIFSFSAKLGKIVLGYLGINAGSSLHDSLLESE